ncbi:autophagy protein 5-like [Triticum dicoccoides]|uniref:autophagy protein 5-like n=1 Tax=Triticum dicoccoides TaxID=85692 RepID=UPI00189105CC|nr:autophagy protein 5-like [Triticum dicoccoides]
MSAARWHWIGAVPLQLFGPRIGYFPLLVSIIKAHFSSSLPPGVDTVWFEYKGLPLKWYIPIGVLFDLLCAEPERPWNLTVHFRGYPADILSPCEGEDSVKWNYNNSLKEAAFIITGNSKNVMNMSQADQLAMWESVRKSMLARNYLSVRKRVILLLLVIGDVDSYMNISTKLKLGPFEDHFWASSLEPRQGSDEPESPGSVKPCRVPVRLYMRRVQEDLEYLEDAIPVSDWESVSNINRPFEIRKEGDFLHIYTSCCFAGRKITTLGHALETLLPEFFGSKATARAAEPASMTPDSAPDGSDTTPGTPRDREAALASPQEMDVAKKARVKLVRIQGMELGLDMPFLWVANNLRNPECFLHVCVYIGA